MAYRTVLIEENALMQERLSGIIRNTPGFEVSARYTSAGEAMGQMQAFSPNLILLNIDRESNVNLLKGLRRNYPSSMIIGISKNWNAEEQAKLLRDGAAGYMIKPFTGDELQAAVKNANRSLHSGTAKVISFFSAKGKSGKTTLIANLAAALARQTGESVAIIDGDLQFGDMAVFFNLTPQSTIVEAVRDIKFLSPITLKTYFVEVENNLQVLCGTSKPDMAESVTVDGLESLIHMAQNLFSYILIDSPSGFSDISATACELSDETFLMAMINGGYETTHTKRALEIFKSWDDYEKRVFPLFTRVEPCDEESRKTLSKAIDYPVTSIIPNAYLEVSEAANNGRLILDEHPDSPFSKAVNELARKIAEK